MFVNALSPFKRPSLEIKTQCCCLPFGSFSKFRYLYLKTIDLTDRFWKQWKLTSFGTFDNNYSFDVCNIICRMSVHNHVPSNLLVRHLQSMYLVNIVLGNIKTAACQHPNGPVKIPVLLKPINLLDSFEIRGSNFAGPPSTRLI